MGDAMQALVGLLKGEQRRVAVLVGAGLSVGSGIPDFRSPGGLYETLQPELLTATEQQRKWMKSNPTAVVDWQLFRENQFPYLEVRRPFILGINQGKWKPTLTHFFLRELALRGMLVRLYTQNIDGLDYQLPDVDPTKIVSCHGSLGTASCEFCGLQVEMSWFLEELQTKIRDIYGIDEKAPKTSSPILCPSCKKPGVKPSTVLYGRNLPQDFFEAMETDFPDNIDLVMVIGTSLTVGPANMIPLRARTGTPRVIVNMEPVGLNLGLHYRSAPRPAVSVCGTDFFLQGSCDKSVFNLMSDLGWIDAIKPYLPAMAPSAAKLFGEQVEDVETEKETNL